ncbi:MAG: hypothetical protein ACRDVG_06780 [Jatrophihabitantaceae bacterium]
MLSGAPSTGWALLTGADPLAATRAAGRLVLPRTSRPLPLLAVAALAHGALSLGWTAVLVRLPGGAGRGAAYGGAIAALDLGLARTVRGERFGPVADLPVLPQLADHVLFGILVSARAGFSSTGRARPSAPRAAR